MTNMDLKYVVKINKFQKSEYTITYGQHQATVSIHWVGKCNTAHPNKGEGALQVWAFLEMCENIQKVINNNFWSFFVVLCVLLKVIGYISSDFSAAI